MAIRIAQGSFSDIKGSAIAAALESEEHALSGLGVTNVRCTSGEDPQPVGYDATLAGARRRALAAADAVNGAYGFGIESGIDDPRATADSVGEFAVIVIVTPDGREFVSMTDTVQFPMRYVRAAQAVGFDKMTVGMAVAAEHPEAQHDDPHSFLTGEPNKRAALIEQALRELLDSSGLYGEFREHQEAFAANEYQVVIGDTRRRLPRVELGDDGIVLNIFDPLGDWEINEAAGVALARKIQRLFPDAEALLMADGKATALLHVLGRELQLDTIVTRKKHRPLYVGADFKAVTYTSITTDEPQTLYVSAKQVSKVAHKKVLLVDDVISTGGTFDALERLLADVQASSLGRVCAFVEGDERPGVVCLGYLPIR